IFDFGPLLGTLFGIADTRENFVGPVWSQDSKRVELTNIEKVVLDSLVKYPEATAIELSKKTGKTRSTVSKIRKEMLSNGLIKVVNIPSMEKLGCELLTFFYTRFSPKCPFEVRKEKSQKMMEMYYPILKVSGDMESIALCIMKNYTEYTHIHNNMLSFYKNGDILGTLSSLLFPIQQIKLNKMDFSSITHKMLFENSQK
ncbi:MAG TPA: helix-turn-helix domain-containing protein, partial [archaeon]|nr:helix-turn-helix domain-containing protein [archaeon]